MTFNFQMPPVPTMIMMVGIPGSGKSTMAQKFGLPIYSSDEIRVELNLDPTKKEDNNKVFEELHSRIIQALTEGQSAVYDATNMSRKKRMRFLRQLNMPVIKQCVILSTPVDICIERDSKREKPVGEEVIRRMVGAFQVPWLYEGWDKILCIPNEESYLIPTEDMDQQSKHHKLTLNQHQEMAEELAYERGYGKMVQDAALYHDIGKRCTQKIDHDGDAHYYNHHNWSAYLYLSGFTTHTMNDLYVTNLINWHMAPYMEWHQSPQRMDADHQMMGDQMFGDIWRLHEVDKDAH